MENIIIAQDRNIAVNLRHIYILEVCASKTLLGNYNIIARTSVQSDFVVLGSFSRKDMAVDVRNDIILWNNQNYNWEWHIEYSVPQDNPDYQSVTDAITLPAAQKMTGAVNRKDEEICLKTGELLQEPPIVLDSPLEKKEKARTLKV
ncbi:MAG: hypothetical protein J6I68_14240 [Butyrivibrio sp.]|uniref:hypothetical protein n=1 Tax=Butyrivibrio sp. TaxID=28121 RepID=UPI001B41930B|nr:hypothetical protein [Butyrivibrio sp.]MBP3784401.1 hypothetical protein [Butyrivibrio sp.]